MTIKAYKEFAIKNLSELYEARELEAIIMSLLADTLKVSFTQLRQMNQTPLTDSTLAFLMNAIPRLQHHEPVQYITGQAHFLNFSVEVNPSVLIPRPETEELVEWIFSQYKDTRISLIDLGTGSGCIVIGLGIFLQNSVFYASDIDDSTLRVAEKNAERNHVKVHFFKDDFLHPDVSKYPLVDVIVSNPPYIPASEIQFLEKNVADYEPQVALFTNDEDALFHYKAIIELSQHILKPGGKVFFETHEAYAGQLLEYMSAKGFDNIILKQDLQGKNRMMCASKTLHNP